MTPAKPQTALDPSSPETAVNSALKTILAAVRIVDLGLISTVVLLLSTIVPAKALDPGRRISQYGHTSWRLRDGLFAGAPTSMAQTTDGYLWIGTANGLIRFDGVRFVPWVFPGTEALMNASVNSLLGSQDGSLWIGTGGGLSQLKDGHLVHHREKRGRINALSQGDDGTIWFVRSRARDDNGPFCRVRSDGTTCFGKSEGILLPWAQTLASDRHGGFWIGGTGGLSHWTVTGVNNYPADRIHGASANTEVNALVLLADGRPLVGLQQPNLGLGLQTLQGKVWSTYALPETPEPRSSVAALHIDRDGGIWISAIDGGLYRAHAGGADRFRQADGLSSDTIMDFFEDREGNLWTISPDGIDRFRNLPVATYSRRDGLPANLVGSVSASTSAAVWIGGGASAMMLRNGKLSVLRGLPNKRITSLLEDHAGRLWAGDEAGLSVTRDGKSRTLTKDKGGVPLNMVSSLAEDREGNVWALVIGRPQRLLCIRGSDIVEVFEMETPVMGGALAADPNGGIWAGHVTGELTRHRAGAELVKEPADGAGAVRNLWVDPDGSTLAASEKGLVRRKDGSRRRLDRKNGLACDDVLSVIRDQADNLWLYATCGLLRIASTEFDRWWAHPESTISAKLFDSFDGAHPAPVPFGPVVSRSTDGRLWFSNDSAIQFVDPRTLAQNSIPPPVQIEQIVADRVVYQGSENLRLPALTRDVQIDYTALSVGVPQKVRFRYQLEGRESWQDPGTRRQAFYTDLRPGKYRFHVIACNNDGVWNEKGASLDFTIPPAWYQTDGFLASCVIAFSLFVWGLYRLRLHQLASEFNTKLKVREAERTRIARDLHDTVLQSLHGLMFRCHQSSENVVF